MEEIYNKILENTYTFSKLKHRVSLLREYLLARIFSNQKMELNPEENEWIESLGEDFLQKFTKDNVYQYLDSIESTVKSQKPLVIYLTFDPGVNETAKIGQYLRSNFTDIPIFDLKIDPELIGGCALVSKGVYKDYSLRAQVDNKKSELLEEFKRYVK